MSWLSVAPDIVSTASGNLQKLGSALRSASAAAASQTAAVAAPAADQVSAAISTLLGTRGQEFHTLNAQAAAFHDEFVNRLSGAAAQYASTELANAQQTLVNTVSAPAQALLGHPLIGTGQGAEAGAGANSAATIVDPNQVVTQSANIPFGPFQISLSQTGVSDFTAGTLSGVSNAAVTLNSPLGPVGLLSGSGTEFLSADGQVFVSLTATSGLFSATGSLGVIYNFTIPPVFGGPGFLSISTPTAFGPLGGSLTFGPGFLPPIGVSVDLFGLQL